MTRMERLEELGIALPPPMSPAGLYRPAGGIAELHFDIAVEIEATVQFRP